MAMAVGATATSFITPSFVQASASPIGTVMSTQRQFSIQGTFKYIAYVALKILSMMFSFIANVAIKRPTRNGSQIRIYIASNSTLVWSVDCRYSPDVFYNNNTFFFYVRNYRWTLGETYFVTFLEGVATADQYCGMESPAFGSEMLREKVRIAYLYL
jgi:hypothetical protein